MDDWHQRLENEQEIEPMDIDGTHALSEPDDDESELVVPETGTFMRTVSSNVAYRWLITNLKRDIGLTTSDESATTRISNKILSSIQGPRKISRHKPCDTKIVTLTMEWNPKEFLSVQFLEEDLVGHTISDTITLTGSSRDAFAASCRDYLDLVWPNTGMNMASLIDNISSNAAGSSYSCKHVQLL